MKTLAKFNQVDSVNKAGILFVVFFIVPCIIALAIEVLNNGSNML